MERDRKKQKIRKAVQIIGVTGTVYLSFRFLLPLFAPFLLAGLVGVMLNPAVKWLREKAHVPLGMGAAVLAAVFLAALGSAVFFLIRELAEQVQLLVGRIPIYLREFDIWFRNCCCEVERFLKLPDGTVFRGVTDAVGQASVHIQENGMGYVVDNSLSVVKGLGTAGAWLAVFLIASVMAAKDLDLVRSAIRRSVFREEIERILRRLREVGGAYLRSEVRIVLLVAAVSALGLWLLKNPYALLAGVGIAFVDLLPIFGSGAVYLPWVLLSVLQGRYGKAAVLMTLYVICYFLRNTIEAKKMGNHLGLPSFVMLMAAFIGWKLFGLAGFFLGPIGLLLILEFTR